MRSRRILILGGTGEARALAALLAGEGHAVITSLAGVTENPLLPAGEVRRGGFGGAVGLASYLRQEDIAVVVDATHPFAARMSANAHAACAETGLPLFRLERAAWQAGEGDRWTHVSSMAKAAAMLPTGARVLLTIGRKELAPFLARGGIGGVARMIEPPPRALPPGWLLLLRRPPFSVASEMQLIQEHGVTWLVTKNAGGAETEAKLIAARKLGLPAVMVERPPKPEVQTFAGVEEMASLLCRLLSP